MDSERERIQKLLDGKKISLVESEKLFQALEEKRGEEEKVVEEGIDSSVGKRSRLVAPIIIGSAVLIVILYLVLSGLDSGDAQENLLLNPGFEKGADGRLASWVGGASYGGSEFLGRQKGGVIFSWDREVSRSGSRCVSIVNTESVTKKALSWRQNIKSFPAGSKLRLTGYIKSREVPGNGNAAIVLRGLKGLKEETFYATTAMSYDLTGTKDWTEVRLQVLVAGGTEELQILCQLEGSGTLWCDDLELRVVE